MNGDLSRSSTIHAASNIREVDSNRPRDVAFKQQRLKAWQPILTPGSILPLFFGIGILFIVLGAIFIVEDTKVKEASVEYTNCDSLETPGTTCASIIANNIATSCTCSVSLTLDEDWNDGQIYLYYELGRYYQNHRRYVKSRDDIQLRGNTDADSACDPLQTLNGLPIAPCGYIANSFFNDSFTMALDGAPVTLLATNIAWKSDLETKFENPDPQDNLTAAFENTATPPNWPFEVFNFSSGNTDNAGQGYVNQDFIVWMRTSALPTFRKLYRFVGGGLSTLNAGSVVTFTVSFNYPVATFDGTKKLVLSTTSILGGKNNFLGIAYCVVGGLTLLAALVFLALFLIYPRKFGEYGHRGAPTM